MVPTLFGRSSSHFTRVTRVFAAELGVEYDFEIVRDLTSRDASAYGGHPALRVPLLKTADGVWFGALNICRELQRRSTNELRVIWPEQLVNPASANAQELTLQAMANEVTMIMSSLGSAAPSLSAASLADTSPFRAKVLDGLERSLTWLDDNLDAALAALPPGPRASYLEITLFCLITHLDFRGVASTAPYARLGAFAREYGARPSAEQTPYRFDT
jgi:glutathione S-transferase